MNTESKVKLVPTIVESLAQMVDVIVVTLTIVACYRTTILSAILVVHVQCVAHFSMLH